MSETTEPVDQKPTETTPQGGEQSPVEKGLLHDLQEERGKRQSLQKQLDKIQKDNEKAEQQRLEDEGKLAELNETLKAKIAEYEPVVQEYTDFKASRKSALLEKLGDDAEDFKNLGIAELEKLVDKLTKTNPPPDPGQPGMSPEGEFGGYKSMQDLAHAAARHEKGARELYDALRKK